MKTKNNQVMKWGNVHLGDINRVFQRSSNDEVGWDINGLFQRLFNNEVGWDINGVFQRSSNDELGWELEVKQKALRIFFLEMNVY